MTMSNDRGRRDASAPASDLFMPNHAMTALLAQNWWAIVLRGLFALLFGVIAILLPAVTITSLVLLFAAYMLIDWLLALIAALRAARHHERWGLLILEGVANLAAGAIALVFPLATVLAFILLMGVWAIFSGALLLVSAFRLHAGQGRWLMGFGGAISMLWGLLLIVWPLFGAVVVTWWIGAYALLFGISLLMLGFHLRHERDRSMPSGTAAAHP